MLADPSSPPSFPRWPFSRVVPWMLLGVLSGLVGGGTAVFLIHAKNTPPSVLPPPAPVVPVPAAAVHDLSPVPPVLQPVPEGVTRVEWMQTQNELKRLRADTQHLRTQLTSLQERHRTLYANWRKTETWRRGFLTRMEKTEVPEEEEGQKPEQDKP